MARPRSIEMLGADPMFQEYQKSGVWQRTRPKRNLFATGAVVFIIVLMAGILITLVTNANWLYCVPLFLLALAVILYLAFKDWKDMRK